MTASKQHTVGFGPLKKVEALAEAINAYTKNRCVKIVAQSHAVWTYSNFETRYTALVTFEDLPD